MGRRMKQAADGDELFLFQNLLDGDGTWSQYGSGEGVLVDVFQYCTQELVTATTLDVRGLVQDLAVAYGYVQFAFALERGDQSFTCVPGDCLVVVANKHQQCLGSNCTYLWVDR